MAKIPTDTEIRRLAHACQFGEFGTNARDPDRFGPLIVCVGDKLEGFVTKVLLDPLRHFGSRPLVTDGEGINWRTKDFEPRIPLYRTKKISRMVKEPIEYAVDKKRWFAYERATYVFTLTGVMQYGYAFERGFLFYNQAGFDIEQIIEKITLLDWRTLDTPVLIEASSVSKT
jgi:hypothetical protein